MVQLLGERLCRHRGTIYSHLPYRLNRLLARLTLSTAAQSVRHVAGCLS